MDKLKQAITFSFDTNYRPWAESLIKSINRHAPGFDIYVRYVTTDDSDVFTSTDNVKIVTDIKQLNTKRTKFKSFPDDFHLNLESICNYSRLLASDLMIYTNHSKFKNIVELLEAEYDLIIAVNCDFIFVDNINILLDKIMDQIDLNAGNIIANFREEHKAIQRVTDIGEPTTIEKPSGEVMTKPADDDFIVTIGNVDCVRDIFNSINNDLSGAATGNSCWNDDGGSLCKHINESKDVVLHTTPLAEFNQCCLINLDHLYTTPIELFTKYPHVQHEVKIFHNKLDDHIDIQVHENFFNKLKDINPDLYLPKFEAYTPGAIEEKQVFFEEEMFIHIRKSSAYLYFNHLDGSRVGLSGISIRKVDEFDETSGVEIENWSRFLFEVKL